jgi:non-heme chloroperoxidase
MSRMDATRRVRQGVAAGAAAALSATVAGVLVTRRWAAAHDPTEGEPLCLPDGDDVEVTTADGATIVARVAGHPDGPVTVMVHGWTNDRRVWGPVAKRLVAKGHRVVLYDQRGHGASTVGADGLVLDALGADLRAVLEQLDVRDAVVAGHSMGGMAAQAFAIGYPDVVDDRVAALVLVASACDGAARGDLRTALADFAIADLPLRLAPIAPFFVRYTVGRHPHLGHLAAQAQLFTATPPAIRRQLRAAMRAMDLTPHLADLTVRTRIVAGRRDQLLAVARSERIAELIPGAELTVMDDHGHMLPWEAPDELAEVLGTAATEPAQ